LSASRLQPQGAQSLRGCPWRCSGRGACAGFVKTVMSIGDVAGCPATEHAASARLEC
jgi:hypothetical protein